MSKILGYNLRKPYKMVVSQQGTLIIQNGVVYEAGSGKALGSVASKLAAENKDLLYCKFSGATFPNTAEGKDALHDYQSRKGYLDKESDGTKEDHESTLAERKAQIATRRDKLNKEKD